MTTTQIFKNIILVFVVLMVLYWILKPIWDAKAEARRKVEEDKKKWPRVPKNWPLVVLLMAGLNVAGQSSELNARLVNIRQEYMGRYRLTLLSATNDTVQFQYGTRRMKLRLEQWYHIEVDSNRYKIVNGNRYYRARIRRIN